MRRAGNRGVSVGRAPPISAPLSCAVTSGAVTSCAAPSAAVTGGAVTSCASPSAAVTSCAPRSAAGTSGVTTGRSTIGCWQARATAVVVGAAVPAPIAPAVRAASGSAVVATPARESIPVKIPDQPNMAVKAMTSKSARLIVAVTNSHPPAKRNTKTRAVEITRRRFRRWSRIGVVINSAAKPSTIMPATLSCRSLLLFKGTQPTSARFTPITVRQTNATVAAPRRPAREPSRRSSRRTRTA